MAEESIAADDRLEEEFRVLSEEMQAGLPQHVRAMLPDAKAALPDWRVPREIDDLGRDFSGRLMQVYGTLGHPRSIDLFGAALVAELAAELPTRLVDRCLPEDVMALVPGALDRLRQFLRSGELSDYQWGSSSNDFFLKDIRFVAGLTVPCGAQVVDLRKPIGRRVTLSLARRRPSAAVAAALLRGKALGPWLARHTELRYLDEFNEAGLDRAYLRMASLLKKHHDVHGVVATSWYYDPQVAVISPRLAYLRLRPVERGAVLLKLGSSEFDVWAATVKSPSRRKLYDEGLYTPTAYTLLWLRKEILSWARTQPVPPLGRAT